MYTNDRCAFNLQRGYRKQNTTILTDKQVVMKAFSSIQMNSKTAWECLERAFRPVSKAMTGEDANRDASTWTGILLWNRKQVHIYDIAE